VYVVEKNVAAEKDTRTMNIATGSESLHTE
jgi:hypothetical protein